MGLHTPVKLTVLLPDPSLLRRLICCTLWQRACHSLSFFLTFILPCSLCKAILTTLHFCWCGSGFIADLPAKLRVNTELFSFLKHHVSFHIIWGWWGLSWSWYLPQFGDLWNHRRLQNLHACRSPVAQVEPQPPALCGHSPPGAVLAGCWPAPRPNPAPRCLGASSSVSEFSASLKVSSHAVEM